jgi:gliding motility-associated-like protein
MMRFSLTLTFILLFHAFSFSQVNLTQGLVAYYPFNGNANDASGNGNHGIVRNGATPTADRFGAANSAYHFDGIDDFIQVPNSPTLNQSQTMTVVAYFYPEQNGTQTIVGKIDYTQPSGTQFQFAMDYAPQPGILYGVNPSNNGCIGAGTNAAYVSTGGSVALNQWYCAIATFDNGVMKFYVNGTLIQTTNSGFTTLNACTNATIQIGSWWSGDPQRFKGKIDDVRIYNRALGQQEIVALCPLQPASVVASFSAPDTVCVTNPVNITNTTSGATSYFWNFCVADISQPPLGTNLGNISNNLSQPVFMDYVFVNNNYYGFVVNHLPGGLVRLDFGNSLLNTPTAVNLGGFNGLMPALGGAEGIRVVQNNGKWYAIIVGGSSSNGTLPRIFKVDFGANITNPTPVATDWGNLGNMEQPIDLDLFQENNNWFGFTVNAVNNTITRFNFTNSFDNTPTATNLGNIGGLNYPTGIYTINDNGNYRVFITNAGNQPSLTRLDFGSSLLNTPAGINLGNPGNILLTPRDLTIMRSCGQIVAFVVNGQPGFSNISSYNFNNDLSSIPTAASLGNIGNLNFAHSISRLFRVNEDIYGFVTNVSNNTITRFRFPGCTNASIPNSTAQDPPPITYNTPGTYNINFTVDDGLPTQSAFCKQVVVLPAPVQSPTQRIKLCTGIPTIRIGTGTRQSNYLWNTGATTDSIDVNAPGTYWVQIDRFGCSATDTFIVRASSCLVTAAFTAPDTVCVKNPVTITNTSVDASSYFWNFCVGNLNNPPVGTNLGNIGNAMSSPVYIDYVLENGSYYGFVTDNYTGKLFRLDFGNNLLNTPALTDLGTLGGVLTISVEGIQVIKNEGKWYVLVVGGEPAIGIAPFIVKVELGANITNPNPVATNWGNLGNMQYPHDLYVFNDGPNWYGLTVNTNNNTITRFNFTNSFSNTPTAVNLGNIGTLAGPTGIHAVNDNGNWYAFVTNANGSTITRLNFGTSLLNTPTGQNIGNPGGLFQKPWDIYVIKFCGDLLAYVLDANGFLAKLDFNNSITNNTPAVQNFGNIGNMNFPHCLSKIFRDGADLYTFVPNVSNSSLSRIRFPGCTNASIPNSTAQDPPPIIYNTPGTYNINLTVDDGLPTQTTYCRQVVVLPAPVQSPTQNKDICAGGNLRIGSGAKKVTYLWNTGATTDSIDITLPGTYWVEINSFDCKITDTFKVVLKQVSDFTFNQDVCNPYSIQFFNAGSGTASPWWDMGDGTIVSGVLTQNHVYTAFGDYKVRFSVSDGGCADTVTKVIAINALKEDIVLTPDTVICNGTTKQLRAAKALSYCWSPTTWLDNPAAPNPVSNTPQDITYYLYSKSTGNNLITNGNFSAGNTGFGSDYTYSAGNNTVIGVYGINTDPSAWNTWAGKCNDHTGSNGNMMLFDGDGIAGQKVWYTTIAITPNTNYAFSCWIQSIFSGNPANLQFFINGKLLGNVFNASSTTCQWEQFYETWNSGNNTTANIAIINQNTNGLGNDFALDDLSFAQILFKQDSVVIKVEKPKVKTVSDTTLCKDKPVTLFTTGAATYTWSPATGLSNPGIADPIATPVTGTQYIVTGTTIHGCVAKDTVVVNRFAKPVITKTADSLVCRNTSFPLFIAGGASYSWSPADQLSNTNSDRPMASVGIGNITYKVAITDSHSCNYLDSVQIAVRPYPVFTATRNQAICEGISQPLKASGGDVYQWTPANLLDDPQSPTPVATPDITTWFSVHVQESSCHFDTTMNMRITINPRPVLTVNKANDVNCNVPTAQLKVAGALQYTWSPASGLDDPRKADPVAAIDTTTNFEVKGTNQFGCTSSALVKVIVTKDGIPRFVGPNAFTPNGDGNNDCFGIKRWGNTKVEMFIIYNRWGQRVFQSNNSTQCWDGTLNGKPLDPGGYVYVIKARTICGEVTQKGMVMLIR